MMIKTIFAASLLAVSLVSCNSAKTDNESALPDMRTSQTSLDWAGTYTGHLPCATCDDVETELTLTSENDYTLTQANEDDQREPKVTKGKFSWKENHIVLEGMPKEYDSNLFKVEEGRLRMLDKNGNVVSGDAESAYLLGKNGNLEVENKKWKLVEIHGKKVKGDAESHYVVFHSESNEIEAKAGCNQLTFKYKITNGLALKVLPGISTMMACEDNTEELLKSVMMEADNISVNEKTLTLNKARMAPLAVFEIVE